jgi:hypothetical protein
MEHRTLVRTTQTDAGSDRLLDHRAICSACVWVGPLQADPDEAYHDAGDHTDLDAGGEALGARLSERAISAAVVMDRSRELVAAAHVVVGRSQRLLAERRPTTGP